MKDETCIYLLLILESRRGQTDAHPFLVLNNVISYGGQRGPFAVVGRANGTALVSLELANCRGQINTRPVR